jgi:bifunctional DNA primase/polymerase-like protein
MTMLRPALAYASRMRIAVHPIARSKAPLSPHGFKDATTDARQIREWWALNPDANIGAKCDWFFVVDVDPRNGGHRVLEQWRALHGDFPVTWEALTGSGGLHIYFRHDDALDSVPLGKLAAGVDIKGGSRGYVLLPPSVNKSGPYRWRMRPSACELATAPRWLIRTILQIKTPPKAEPVNVDATKYAGIDRVERARRYARALPPAINKSGGSPATWLAAMKIARGFDLTEDEAFTVLATEWNPSCKPPWTAGDLRRQIERARRLGSIPIGCFLDRRTA